MELPGLDTALVRLTNVFPFYIEFMLALMALGGLLCVAGGIHMGYSQASEGGRGQSYGQGTPTPWKAIGLVVLGGALTVPLVILWDIAGTFVFGGDETYNMLSYLPAPTSSPWCVRVKSAVILFFMSVGITAFGWGAVLANDRIRYQAQGATVRMLTFVAGGVACFFVNDLAMIVSNTFGLDISFDNVCTILGTGDGA